MSFTNMATDPRVRRQFAWLQGRYRIVALGTGDPNLPGIEYHQVVIRHKTGLLPKLPSLWYLLTGQDLRFFWNHAYYHEAVAALAGVRPDVVIANDLDTLPVALRAARGAPVLFDAHEYYPREFDNSLFWRLVVGAHRWQVCRETLPQARAITTVCAGIAEEYRRQFYVDPVVVTNAPAYVAATPGPTDPQRIRIIHHGATMPVRRIESMIAMMDHLDARFELDLMLIVSDVPYMKRLQALAAPNPKIRFRPAMPPSELVATIAAYDIGLYLLEPSHFNNRHALPNKFFEFIQARLAIAIGPSPEMAALVRAHGLGVVADDFQSATLARCLNALTASDIDRFKAASDSVAGSLCAEKNGETVRALLASWLPATGA